MVICAVLMTTFSVMMLMMVTARVRIIIKRSCRQCKSSFIRRALYACIQFDSGISQCHLSAHTNPAADQHVNLLFLQ